MTEEKAHKAGFVSIIGKPNVGKSTLMNQMVGERLSIITAKAQTTRHRIMGILSGDDFQIVYSDTPGVIQPKYELQRSMMRFVNHSLEDADVILWVNDVKEENLDEAILEKLKHQSAPVLLLVNKIDLASSEEVVEKVKNWQEQFPQVKEIIPLSALEGFNVEKIFQLILELIPEHPPYFPKDALTDKPEKFFASEILREKIFESYRQEIPYACEVVISEFKEEEEILRIRAEILVERDSQKGILIGKGGMALKKIGSQAREDMEVFFQKKVFLQQFVKVEPNWRQHKQKLGFLGYN